LCAFPLQKIVNILFLFALFVDGSVMPSWFDILEIPVTAVSLAVFSLSDYFLYSHSLFQILSV